MSNLEDWEKKLIKSENLEGQELELYLAEISNFCTLSVDGYVLLKPELDKNLPMKDKIHLIMCARFVAHELQVKLARENPISDSINSEDLSRMLMADKTTIQARVSDLKRERKVTDSGKGVYKATLQGIKPFLEHLRGERSDR